jgi:hypothetical protein
VFQVAHREMHREGRARGRQGREVLPFGHGRGLHGGARQDHGLAHVRQGQLLPQGRGGRGIGRHAGRHVVGDAEILQPADLLGDRAVERGVAGMDPRDVLARLVGLAHLLDDLIERHGRRVDHPGAGPGTSQDFARHQRAGVEHHGAARDQVPAADRDQVRRPRPGADEVHGHATSSAPDSKGCFAA